MEITVLIPLLLICEFALALPAESSPIISTRLGNIVGKISDVHIQHKTYEVQSFLGIPYAKPPVRNLRFKKPLPAENFKSTYNATVFRPACPRIDIRYPSFPVTLTEDCLNLNIFVPRKKTENNQEFAVMVYIHGDELPLGNENTFVPDVISSFGDVIVVTLTYRSGMLGLLNLDVKDGKGNLGLWDQQLALQWINKHIGAFGGDKNRITLFGHSDGATYSIFQALHTSNKGLIHRVISQSGTHLLSSNFVKEPIQQFRSVSKAFDCEGRMKSDSIKCLQSIELEKLISKFNNIKSSEESMHILKFLPNIDNDFFSAFTLETISIQEELNYPPYLLRPLDILMGFNSHDGLLFGDLLAGDLNNFNPSVEEFRTQCVRLVMKIAKLDIAPLVTDLLEAEYINSLTTNDGNDVRNICIDIITDIMFAVGSLEIATANSRRKQSLMKIYAYHFTANPTSHVLPTPCWINGAGHGDELQFVFGFPDETPECRHSFFTRKPEDWEIELSYKIMTYWTNFAKSGNPNLPIPVFPHWPNYDHQSPGYLEISEDISETSVKYHLQDRQLRFWKTVFPFVREASLDNMTESCEGNDLRRYETIALTCDLK